MATNHKAVFRTAVMAILVIAAFGACLLLAGASSEEWSDHAEISWYDPTYTTYTIDSPAKLAGVAKLVNDGVVNGFENKILQIDRDLDLSAYRWVPIGTGAQPFRGSLISKDGQDIRIDGMRLEGNVPYAGLVGVMDGGTIGGFTFGGSGTYHIHSVTEVVYAGAAVGESYGLTTVFDIVNELDIRVDGAGNKVYAGGIAGRGEGTISNSNNNGSVSASGDASVGGIAGAAGHSGLKLKRITNDGAVSADGENYAGEASAGGIVGRAQGMLEMSEDATPVLNTGAIQASSGSKSYAGGIVGRADGDVRFSASSTNEGDVTIDAPNGAGSYAGALVGAILAEQANRSADVSFVNTGAVTNNGGTDVHTGGIAGLLQSLWTWERSFTGTATVTASGTSNVHTGGFVGKATREIRFVSSASNAGAMAVGGGAVPNEAYTGGFVGYAEERILLEAGGAGAYVNSGLIQVTGGNGLYTGGIAGNRFYARTAGTADNVASTGNIEVTGGAKVYTGGYVGILPVEAMDKSLTGAVYAGKITVVAASADGSNPAATGGIVGYSEDGAAVSQAAFRGEMDVQGGTHTYTGGIVGYADGAALNGASAGNTADRMASIASDGHAGGIAGYVKGNVDSAAVKYISLTMRTTDGFMGGVAGKAQGVIDRAVVGDAAGDTLEGVLLAGADRLTAGGIVGANESELQITSGSVDKIALVTQDGSSEYTFGGVAGRLTSEARVGAADVPVTAQTMNLTVNSDSSAIGGAVGENASTELFLATEDISIAAAGNDVLAGGVIGKNTATIGMETASLSALRPNLTASGSGARLGGVAGENNGLIVKGIAQDGTITLTGASNIAGGIAGRSTNELIDNQSINMSIAVQTDGGEAGGIVGRSEPGHAPDGTPLIKDAVVEQRDMPLLQVSQPNAKVGGIAGIARSTEIADPVVGAVAPNNVILLVQASAARAGGVAGEMNGGFVSGDSAKTNVTNLLINVANGAEDTFSGGIVGYNDNAKIDKVVVKTAMFTLNGARSTVGGAAGFHLGTDPESIISNAYLETISIRAMASAERSTIGGAIGLNEARPGDPAANPDTSVSTLQNTRLIGSPANPNSPVIDSRAPFAVIGGLVGENRAFVANNSIIDKIPLNSRGNGSIFGGHTGVNRNTGKLYYTYANARLTIEGEGTAAGGLAGSNEGYIIASYVDTDVTGAAFGTAADYAPLGGLVGRNRGTIDKSYSVSVVTSNGKYTYAGGLVGAHEAGAISNSYTGKDVAANMEQSYAGGFAGRITDGTVSYSYSAANVTAAADAFAGGFAGRYDNESKELLYKNYYIKDEAVNLNKDLPDFADGNHRWLNASARLSTMLAATLRDRTAFPGLSGWDFTNVWRYGSPNAAYLYPELIRAANSGGGDGGHNVNANVAWYTQNKDAIVYDIRTEAELSGLAAIVNGSVLGVDRFDFAGRVIRVVNPIHIQSEQWIPIGKNGTTPFRGTFNGNGHLIDGFGMTVQEDPAGLFGVVESGGRIENVRLEPQSIAGQGFAGALAGVNKGTVANSSVHLPEGVQISGQTVGSVIGQNSGSLAGIKLTSVPDVAVVAAVAQGAAGSLVGENTLDINEQTFTEFGYTGRVTSAVADTALGGWIGKQTGSMTGIRVNKSYTVTSSGENNIAGGLIGHYIGGAMADTVLTLSGGVVEASAQTSIVGGIAGKSDAGQTLRNVTVVSNQVETAIRGNGIVGGIVGDKTGSGTNAFELENVRTEQAEIGSFAESAHSVMGGIAGTIANAAVGGAYFDGKLRPLGEQATAGGIAGRAADTVLYRSESLPDIAFAARAGASSIGGIAGSVTAGDPTVGLALGGSQIPMYLGIYDASVHTAAIRLTHAGTTANITAGGIVGTLNGAAMYFAQSTSPVSAEGFRSATLGGLAGASSGTIVQSETNGAVTALLNTVNRIGGAVGLASGGEIHYSRVNGSAGEAVSVSGTVTRLPALPEVYIGGFAGVANQVKMTNVTAEIDVRIDSENQEDTLFAGGFAGAMGTDANLGNGEVDGAYAKGAVDVNGLTISFAGGFAGSIDRYTVTNAYASGNVDNSGFDTRSGGFAAAVERRALVRNAYAVQEHVEATGVRGATRDYAAGFAGYNEGRLESVYAHASDIATNVTGASAYRGALVGYLFRDGVVTDSAYAAANAPAVGYSLGTSDNLLMEDRLASLALESWNLFADAKFLLNPDADFIVMNGDQLYGSVLLTNESTGLAYFKLFQRTATARPTGNTKLGADIDLTGAAWKPYVQFDRQFDGQGHAVIGLRLNDTQAASVGFIPENAGTISNVRFVDAAVTAGEEANVGIAVGTNLAGGTIANVHAEGSVQGGAAAGGIVGKNEGTITGASADAAVEAAVAGGIAGTNTGSIQASYAGGSIRGAVAGGIVGDNPSGGAIRSVFTYSSVTSETADAKAGGIAGVTGGTIEDSYASGRVAALGTTFARAGGIAGHATGGTIERAMNYGEASALVQGKIVKGKSLYGGIVGQKGSAAAVQSSVFNKQMLRANTAYYNEAGKRIEGAAAAGALGMESGELTTGVLPAGFDADSWQAVEGMFPQLAAFAGQPASKLSAAAIVLDPSDNVYRIDQPFTAEGDADVRWVANEAEVSFSGGGGKWRGILNSDGRVNVTATLNGLAKTFVLQDSLVFAEQAQAPVFTVVPGTFRDQVSVGLTTEEPDGAIYYTLNGLAPTAASTRYTSPIGLTATTTVRAITVADDVAPSDGISGTWQKQVIAMGGGGGGGMAPQKPEVSASIGQVKLPIGGKEPVTVARNSKLTLTVPEGATVYYTTDGSIPTKDSPVYTGELLITGNMQIKFITDLDDKVVTLDYKVAPAAFEVKAEADETRYIAGYPDGRFAPDKAITRYELINSLAPLLNIEDVPLGTLLSDVRGRQAELVAKFESAGLITGYPDGTFGSGKGLKRGEFVTILARMLKLEIDGAGGKSAFSDVEGHWAESYVSAFVQAGYVNGYPDGTFKPEQEITRAEAVVLINKIVGTRNAAASAASFADLTPEHWAYEEIMKALKS